MHWTQTPEGRKRISKRMRALHRGKKAAATDFAATGMSAAETAVKKAIKKDKPTHKLKHIVRIYARDAQGEYARTKFAISSWGELFDLLTETYADVRIEEVMIECNLSS